MSEYNIAAWYDAYVKEKRSDPHQYFADVIGVSRQEAKKLCYELAYKIRACEVMQAYQETK